jgi:hypothetical protein
VTGVGLAIRKANCAIIVTERCRNLKLVSISTLEKTRGSLDVEPEEMIVG